MDGHSERGRRRQCGLLFLGDQGQAREFRLRTTQIRGEGITQGPLYLAFISYRHADNREMGRCWATWLHRALETYAVPPELVGTINLRGEPVPERIYPVFRDEEEFSAEAALAPAICDALQRSKTLIVLCSPRAVQSPYVAAEVRHFKSLGRANTFPHNAEVITVAHKTSG